MDENWILKNPSLNTKLNFKKSHPAEVLVANNTQVLKNPSLNTKLNFKKSHPAEVLVANKIQVWKKSKFEF